MNKVDLHRAYRGSILDALCEGEKMIEVVMLTGCGMTYMLRSLIEHRLLARALKVKKRAVGVTYFSNQSVLREQFNRVLLAVDSSTAIITSTSRGSFDLMRSSADLLIVEGANTCKFQSLRQPMLFISYNRPSVKFEGDHTIIDFTDLIRSHVSNHLTSGGV